MRRGDPEIQLDCNTPSGLAKTKTIIVFQYLRSLVIKSEARDLPVKKIPQKQEILRFALDDGSFLPEIFSGKRVPLK